MAQRAHWENSSAKLIEKRIVRNRIEDMRKRKASDLESRKAKLAALLEAEDRMYEKEFNDNLETPEQVRQKMWERLQELKGIREQERQAEVQKRLDMKFKTSNDDLRKEDSQFYNFGTAIEREKQLIDKRRQHEQRMLEEQIYSQLWELDGQKKLEREITEQAEKKQKISDTMAVLEWQKQTRDLQRNAEVDAIQREREMLKTQWAIEDEKERKAEHERFLLNRERNLDLIHHNAQEKQIREIAENAEKQRDKIML